MTLLTPSSSLLLLYVRWFSPPHTKVKIEWNSRSMCKKATIRAPPNCQTRDLFLWHPSKVKSSFSVKGGGGRGWCCGWGDTVCWFGYATKELFILRFSISLIPFFIYKEGRGAHLSDKTRGLHWVWVEGKVWCERTVIAIGSSCEDTRKEYKKKGSCFFIFIRCTEHTVNDFHVFVELQVVLWFFIFVL